MRNLIDWSIYLCTDRDLSVNMSIEECTELAIQGGVTVVQIREKNCSGREFFNRALVLKKITKKNKIPLIVNDRADIAAAIDADGVHVGQKDLPCSAVRKILGEKKIIGVSASTVELAIQAEADGADYLGVGAVFGTSTKSDAKKISLDTLKKIRRAVKIPIVAIGGINRENLSAVKATGVDGVAVVSAIVSAKNPESAARELSEIWYS